MGSKGIMKDIKINIKIKGREAIIFLIGMTFGSGIAGILDFISKNI